MEDGNRSGVPAALAARIERMLDALDAASAPAEMGLIPGWRLHPLHGDLRGFWSVTVSGNWRIIWRMEGVDAVDVDYLDYH